MKRIALTQSKEAIVDDRDFVWLSELNWYAHRARVDSDMYYAALTLRRDHQPRQIFMHRLIWQVHDGAKPAKMVIDHRDGNKLNNRIANLRIRDPQSNLLDRIYERSQDG